MSAFTYDEWEALWLLTIGQVELSTWGSPMAWHGNALLVAEAGGEDISARFHRLKDRGFVTIHKPGWLNGSPMGWRIEITNEGWKAMDVRPPKRDGEVSGG